MGHPLQKTDHISRFGGPAEFYRAVADNMHDWEFWQDPDGRFLYVSPSARRITGWEAADFQQNPELYFQIMHPDDRERMRRHLSGETETREHEEMEYRLYRRDGQERWISHICRRIYDKQGNFLGWRSSNRDITEQKETQSRLLDLQKELARVARIPEINPNPVLQVTHEGILIWMNQAAESLGGQAWRLEIGKKVCCELLECCVQIAWGEKDVHRELECDGRVFWMIFTPTNGYINVYGRDITERKEAQAATETERRLLEMLIHNIPDPVSLIRGGDLRMMYVNPAYQAIAPGKKMMGRTLDEVWSELDYSFSELCRQVIETGEPYHSADEFFMLQRHPDRPPEPAYFSWWLLPVNVPGEHEKGILNVAHDVTERKEAEEALRDRERQLRAVLDILPVGVLIADAQGRMTNVNLAVKEIWCGHAPLLGTPKDYVEYRGYRPGTNELLKGEEWGLARAIGQGETSGPEEIEIECFDGSRKTILNYALPIRGEDGSINGGVAVNVDITSRREAEKALRNSEERLRAVLENSLDAAYRRDLRFDRYDYISPVIERILGYSPKEMNEMPIEAITDLIHPDDSVRVHQSLEEARQKGAGTLEYRFRCRDGNYHWMSDQFVYEKDAQGNYIYRTGTIRDITRQVKAQETLRESEERLKLAQEASHVGIYDWDLKADRSVWSEEMYRIYGLEPGQYENPSAVWYYNLIHPDDRAAIQQKLYRTISRTREEVKEEYRILRPDGEVRWVSERGIITYGEDAKPIRLIGTSVDITDRKEAEEVLKRSHEELEQRVRQRTEELAEMVDQLRQEARQRAEAEQKLSVSYQELQNRAEQLSRLASELTLAEQRERHRLAQVLHDHLQQLLVAAKMELGTLLPSIEDGKYEAVSDAMNLLTEAVQESRSLSMELSPPVLHKKGLAAGLEWLAKWMRDKYGLKVNLETETEADTTREDIRTLLFQSLRELLFNTVKHSGVDNATVRLERHGENLRITLIDHGRGFDVEAIVKKSARATGGFGLFSIRERMSLLGGRLDIESRPGEGATFRLTVPIPEEPEAKMEPETTDVKQEKDVTNEQTVRILLVDDHAMVRRGMISMLKQDKRLQVVGEAGSGHEAIEQARQLNPDVVLMDLSMPDMDGTEATRIIHEEHPQIRIIGLSMYEEEMKARDVLDAGASAYVSKADPPARLIAAIRKACESS